MVSSCARAEAQHLAAASTRTGASLFEKQGRRVPGAGYQFITLAAGIGIS